MLPPRLRIERGASDLKFLTCRPSSAFHFPIDSFLCLYGHMCKYVLSEKDKQPTFTGREQRVGVWILPFLVAGIFGPGRRKPPKEAGGVPARSTAATRAMDARMQMAARRSRGKRRGTKRMPLRDRF